MLGGLIGLGGAEFRLPVLVGLFGYPAKRAVPLNLAISLVTVTAALAIRSRTLSLDPVRPFASVILAMIPGGVLAAFVGTALARRLSNELLERIILVLLVAIGLALIVESFLPGESTGVVPDATAWRVAAGVLFGLVIGLVSSLLGVAGGELIIPTLVFAFGAGIKTAGTASLLVSLPTVTVGVIRYARQGAFGDRDDLSVVVAPMGASSLVGAVLGGILAGVAPTAVLKFGLGIILVVSALRIFRHQRHSV
jgi:uncharacterized membrane protein YfcA